MVAVVLTAGVSAPPSGGLAGVALLLSGKEFMQKEGTNSAALTFRVENLPSMNLPSALALSPLSASCSHESGATLFAIFIALIVTPKSQIST